MFGKLMNYAGEEIALQENEKTAPSSLLETGIKAIDGFLSIAHGQRIGLCAPEGCGKTAILSMLANHADVDAVIVASIGERPREFREFWDMMEGARHRTAMFAASSSDDFEQQIEAANRAMEEAERLRDEKKRVLLLADSITRLLIAFRESNAAKSKANIARFVERAGKQSGGSITLVCAATVEAPLSFSDATNGLLDGHILLSREAATAGRFPAIDVSGSVSRWMDAVADADHLKAAKNARRMLRLWEENKEMMQMHPMLESFLRQEVSERVPLSETVGEMKRILAFAL